MLIVGCGDIGLRLAQMLNGRVRLLGLTSSPTRVSELRARGITPLVGDLDVPPSISRLAGLATRLVHLAPPPTHGRGPWWRDPRTLSLAHALNRRSLPHAMVYASTSGVYGDCGGEWVNEVRTAAPSTPRAHRRIDAESIVRHLGRAEGLRACILRVPGIYAGDRAGGNPRERLERGTPVLQAQDDVYTNHIHADDLARAVALSMWRGKPQRIYNACDDSELKMGDYFDLAADLFGLPRPQRLSRSAAGSQLPVGLLSFMGESRRLRNDRIKRELKFALRYARVRDGLLAMAAAASHINRPNAGPTTGPASNPAPLHSPG